MTGTEGQKVSRAVLRASHTLSKDCRGSSPAGDLTRRSDVRAKTDPSPLSSSGTRVVQSGRGEVMGNQESERNSLCLF